METGLPTKEIFLIVVNYFQRFNDCVKYYSGWKVDLISLEDQIFMTHEIETELYKFTLYGITISLQHFHRQQCSTYIYPCLI